jgi:Concanavalin A-like lectin/glucanases superfamily
MKTTSIIIAVAISFSAFAAEKTKLPIIAHWSFDNDSGSTLQDSGPNKLNANLKSKDKTAKVETAKGMKGKALKLSAKPLVKYVVQDKKKLLNLKPPFTIAMWIKRTGKMPKSMCLLTKMWDGGKTNWDLRYNWAMTNLRFGDGKKQQMVSSPKYQVKNDKWYHVAATNDGRKVQLFINCEKVKEQTFANAAPAPGKGSVVIGNYVGRADAYNFIGLLDEVYIIGKVLSSEELFKLAAP